MTGADDDAISEETRFMAARVRERASKMLTPQQLADLTAGVFGKPRGKHAADMTPEQIGELVTEAISQSQQMAYLLGKLAGLDGGECL